MKDQELIRRHLRAYFAGHHYEETVWTLGPTELLPNLRIAVLSPGPRTNLWVYATVGASESARSPVDGLEFLITAPEEDLRHVELLTMSSYYHQTEGLGLGQTLPIGEPWLSGSTCDHLLVSLPYPFGPDLEVCQIGDRRVLVYWLVPITKAEQLFKAEHGQEALEQRFDDNEVEFWDPHRPSVV